VERKTYDEKQIKKYARILVKEKYDNFLLKDEDVEEEASQQEYVGRAIEILTEADFRQKLFYEYYKERVDYSDCILEAGYLVNNMPRELWPNLNEWLDDKPLSDIKVHGVSINDVSNMFRKLKPSFVQILTCMTHWKESNYIDNNFCLNYFAIS
jgi:hypothetical protein